MKSLLLKEKSNKPKYKQIVNSIEQAIVNGFLKKGDKLPSLNELKKEYSISRDTVLKAFNELKTRGIIYSIVGKGYYITSENVTVSQKVFLLFDELNSFKEDLYKSFLENLDANIQVDIFFHHFNKKTFENLITSNNGDYNKYVIMPANLIETEEIIAKLPLEKVFILDQIHSKLDEYSALYQNFKNDIYNCLENGEKLIKKYKKLILFFSEKTQPIGMKNGFIQFCEAKEIDFEIIADIKTRDIKKGEVYIIPDDRNLIRIIKKIKDKNFVLKKDIGIISYNDTMLKEILEGGITTISTDFKLMGKNLANIITSKEVKRIENPTTLIIRNSL